MKPDQLHPLALRSGFSLVEVTLAIGVVSFCLLLLMGLLPVGLNTMKSSRDEAAAVNCLEQISNAIRAGRPATGSSYKAFGAYDQITWTLNGAQEIKTLTGLSAGGFPSASEAEQQFVAHLEIQPPADRSSTGAALISVAWPRQANWNAGKKNWDHAQGSVHTWMIFVPGN